MSSSSTEASRMSGCRSVTASNPAGRTKYEREPQHGMVNSSASLQDVSGACQNLVRCLKAVWPSRQSKKSGREGDKRRSRQPSTRALELQLKLQQELIRCEVHTIKDGRAGWLRQLHPELVASISSESDPLIIHQTLSAQLNPSITHAASRQLSHVVPHTR
ncbi:hypothetical protein PCANC_11582 [Puccinia coronata f. sp. avenae]|uniref:Uncharacterized protein n=1 Tax=Puccinia coronata f. sp. avenae TaxID=200324 RepID=A0A2N5UIE4_9BASI|nr:hypothetical protein PCASD_10253 [Puccinia coronata f. sp. avenae]PLW46088.1 hypothetical protein PCANC_11582 [Puccinia coronata f. sp. avenae]